MLSIVLGQAILAVEPNIRNSNLFPVNANGEVLFLSVVSFLNDGNTLTSIAQEHIKDSNVSTSDYIDEVMKNNKLSDDEITSGKKLIIAYYSYEKK